MNVIQTSIPEVLILEPKVFGDDRGFFFESYNEQDFIQKTGIDVRFVQDNHSRSAKNVLRGLHYQIQHPQGKLVHVTRGEIFDVAVDIRVGSPAFGKWFGATLSAEQAEWAQKAIADEGLGELAEVRHSDYRDVPEGDFDAVSSIGLTEHIGVSNYPAYFGFMRDKLRDGGMLLNHCITRPDNSGRNRAGSFIDRYVFPDGELTGSGKIISKLQDIGGMEVVHEENFREHYAMTLRDWNVNLVEHWDEAVEEVGEGTARLWGLYMAGCRIGFDRNIIQLHHVLATKLDKFGNSDLPLRPWWDA